MSRTWVAPGRVNLIGEHVDYNNGLVLPFALPFATTTRVSRRDDNLVHVRSDGVGAEEFQVASEPADVTGWAAYVAGVIWALRSAGHEVPGLDISIASDVPTGAGLSSSAALTCSVGAAIDDELGLGLSRVEIAGIARRSENDYAGAPTGPMDQLVSMLGEEGHVLLLDCRSLDSRSIPFALDDSGLVLQLIDTLARHALVGSEYADRRADCEAAATALGLDSLRDAGVAQLADLDSERLQRRAHHVVSEIQRVKDVVDLLDERQPADIGACLTASHESLRDDFEVSCPELDVAVDAAVAAGALGARMTGGGFGGCVISLCRVEDSERVKSEVAQAYANKGWSDPVVWEARPSAGAHRKL
jgi:galactokinase